uniref:Uncharacterized protein n=1 Tax=Heterorhabditis bacteriophora TaxID=37862 RepID=A0A1I7XBI0_HETBA
MIASQRRMHRTSQYNSASFQFLCSIRKRFVNPMLTTTTAYISYP